MSKCGKGCMPECKYFTTGGCISPFNCMYKEESGYINSATSGTVIYTVGMNMPDEKMIENLKCVIADISEQCELLKAENAALKEKLEKAKKHRVQVLPDGTIKQLYSDEEVEDIARQRDEYKHRAEVAERALLYAVSEYRCDECPCLDCSAEIRGSQECIDCICAEYKKEAERDLAEEKK